MDNKFCKHCNIEKPISEFHRNTSSKDGIGSKCKQCQKIHFSKWYAINKKKVIESSAVWAAENIEKRRLSRAKWESENQEKVRIRKLNWATNNKDKMCVASAKYRSENPEKVKLSLKIWRDMNQEVCRIHYQNRRARKLMNGGVLSADIEQRLLSLQRGRCACGCKQPLGDDYHLDHIMPLALGGSNTDDNIQLLRSKCNLQKHAKHPADFMRQRGFLI